jgi:hypothetical protein
MSTPTMMLITGSWNGKKTFKLIPVSLDCPYNEGIYDLDNKILALIGKDKKESLHMLAKLNEFGDPQTMKIGRRSNGKDYAEERKMLETYYEYFVEEVDEIKAVIKLLAVNFDEFKVEQFMVNDSPVIAPVNTAIITQ